MSRSAWSGAWALAAVVAAGVLGGERVAGEPVIPRVGGVIAQTNVTGHLVGVAVLTGGDFVVSGATDEVAWASSPVGFVDLLPVNALLMRYRADGAFQWKVEEDFGARDYYPDVAVDAADRVFAAGFSYSIQSSGGQRVTVGEARLSQYSGSGARAWSTTYAYPGATATGFDRILLDGSDLVAMGGAVIAGTQFPLLVRATSAGTIVGAYLFTDLPGERWRDVARADEPRSFFVASQATEDGVPRGCMRKVTFARTVWTRCDPAESTHLAAVEARLGKPVAAGLFDDGPREHAALVRRDAAGALESRHLYRWGASVLNRAEALASLPDGTDVASGITGGEAIVDDPKLTNALRVLSVDYSNVDILTMRYAPDGRLEWSIVYDEAFTAIALDAVIDGAGRIVLAGARMFDLVPHPLVVRYE